MEASIAGFQISTAKEGYRVAYNIDDNNNDAVKVGLIYGVSKKASVNDMVVNSNSSYVYDYEATAAGKLSQSGSISQYVMTMTFVKDKQFYTEPLYVRAYAQLKDGTYVYSDVESFSVYDIADTLYQDNKMSNEAGHLYLYNNILKVSNPSYTKKPFEYKNIIVK